MDYFIELFQNPLSDLICGGILFAGLLFIAGIHIYWALGGKWGLANALPTDGGIPLFRPTPGAIFFIGFSALVLALVIPGRLGFYADAEPTWLYDGVPWLTLVVFFFRALGDFRYMGLFRRIYGTPFSKYDNAYYTPFSLLMMLCSLVVAL